MRAAPWKDTKRRDAILARIPDKVDAAIQSASAKYFQEGTPQLDAQHRQNGHTPGINALNALNASPKAETDIPLPPWPTLHSKALYGLAGDIVRLIEPHTETDPVALLGQFLGAFGVAAGHKPTFYVDGSDHYMNLFLVLVGRTAKGRKGTSASHIRRLFHQTIDPQAPDRALAVTLAMLQGLSRGEGLIWQVRDPIMKRVPIKEKGHVVDYQEVIADAGVEDKRLLVLEAEFARVLRVMERDSNTLSATLREAWDTGDLRIMTKNAPARATSAHIGIIGHITAEELQRCLTETEAANGFGNRFLWLCVTRSKLLPEGGNISQVDFYDVKQRVHQALRFARDVDKLTRSSQARALWHDAYPLLTDERPGLLGSMIGRAEAQVLRLSSDGMSRTDMHNALGRNRKAGELGAALERLLGRHLVRVQRVKTEDAKRPTEMWYATKALAQKHLRAKRLSDST
jgi:hypothetical protein